MAVLHLIAKPCSIPVETSASGEEATMQDTVPYGSPFPQMAPTLPAAAPSAPATHAAGALERGSWARLGIYVARRVVVTVLAAVALLLLTSVSWNLAVPTLNILATESPSYRRASPPKPLMDRSWWTGRPVSEEFARRPGPTLELGLAGGALAVVLGGLVVVAGWGLTKLMRGPTIVRSILTALGRLIFLPSLALPMIGIGTVVIVLPVILWGIMVPLTYRPLTGLPQPGLTYGLALAPLVALAGFRELVWIQGLAGVGPWRRLGHFARRWAAGLLDLTGYALVLLVLAESIFGRPGLGRLALEAITQRDFAFVWTLAAGAGLVVLAMRLAADLLRSGDALISRGPLPPPAAPVRTWPLGWIWLALCAALVLAAVLVVVVAPVLVTTDPLRVNPAMRLAAPSGSHPLGTDQLGRDYLARVLAGLRTDLGLALAAAVIGTLFATIWGELAGWLSRWRNPVGAALADLIQIPAEVVRAVPWLLLSFVLISSVFTPASLAGAGLFLLLTPRLVLAMRDHWVRAPAGRAWWRLAIGAPAALLPVAIAGGIVISTVFGFVGVGVPPPTPELGTMLIGSGRRFMEAAPWLFWVPGIVISLLVLPWLLLGDAVTERFGIYGRLPFGDVLS
jgi:peptide/nickel transport system permease protein